jgi:transcriptional regulator with XRE-family HTH domain
LKQEQVNKNIKTLRAFLGLNMEKFGAAIGYSPAYISRIEQGKSQPSLRFIEKVSGQFFVPIDDLYKRNLRDIPQ